MERWFSILLAEDNPVSCKLIEKTLIKTEYDAAMATNGYKEVELFNKRDQFQ